MQIIARRNLRLFWEKYPASQVPLQTWFARVKCADWAGPADIKAMFGSTVDFVSDNRVIFDLGGNKFRLIVHIAFAYRRVLIKFVGTHKQYDAVDAETL